jgi:hypothetical protein
MVMMLGRGEHCPRERQHQRARVQFYGWCAVAFTQLVTVLPNKPVRRTKADYDPTLPEVKDAWERQQTATGGS